MTVARTVLPGLALIVLAIFAGVPWGLPAEARFALALLPYTMLHLWVTRRPEVVPSWLALAAGLIADVVSSSPLGYWALVYLAGYGLATLLGRGGGGVGGRSNEAVVLAMTLGALALLQIAISSLFFAGLAPWRPVVFGCAIALAAHPLLAFVCQPLFALWPRHKNDLLERGR